MGSISHKEFMKIRSHFLNKLIEKKGRTKLAKSKKMFEIYINHVGKYEET